MAKSKKVAFVLQFDASVPAAEVQKRAASRGLKISRQHVYMIRHRARARLEKQRKAVRAAVMTKARPNGPFIESWNLTPEPIAEKPVYPVRHAVPKHACENGESQFRRMVVELGVERAESLLGDVKAKIEQLIAG